MKLIPYIAAITAVLGATTAFAGNALSPASDHFTKEGDVGPWAVYADHSRGTCLIEGVGENGNVVQMGLTKEAGVGYVGVFTKDDIGMRDGAKGELTMLVNDEVYTGEAFELNHGVADGYQGGYIEVTNPEFVTDLQKGYSLIAFPDSNNGAGVVIDLKDSYKAIEAAKACNEKLGAM